MLEGKLVLAVVPARSGSKGIPNKNMRGLGGTSLIGRAGQVLAQLPFLDARVISTDSREYAEEGVRYGLEAPFLRPPHLSSDSAGAVETMQHALLEMEGLYGREFDVILIVEPSSPLRLPEDVERAARRLVASGADSVVTVSPLSSKSHPRKILTLVDETLGFYDHSGATVTARQTLDELYWRNGVCYALTRDCLVRQSAIFGQRTLAEITTHPVVNIDEPWELDWAEFLLARNPMSAWDRLEG